MVILNRLVAFWKDPYLRSRALVVLVLGLSTCVFFLWRLEGDFTAFLYRPGSDVSDLTVTFWPNVTYIQRWVRASGGLPLWRTLIFSGSPFDADPQSGLWYLPNVVFSLLPAVAGFNLLFLLHVLAAGLGSWTWARATGTSACGALLAALTYAFTPKVFAHLGFGHVGLVYAAAYIPWAMWTAYCIGHGNWLHVGTLGLVLGWQFIAHPQLAFYTGLIAGGYGLAIEIASSTARSIRGSARSLSFVVGIGRWLLALLLAVLVAAVQLVPMLRLAPLSARAEMGFSESAVSSLPLRYLWGLLLADYRGFMDYVLYVGLPVLALAVVSILYPASRRRRQARCWGVLVISALIYSLGTNTPLYKWAFRLLPALSWLRAPSRIWFVVAAVLALLAGWGADRLLEGMGGRDLRQLKRFALALGVLAPALAVGYAVALGKPPMNLIVLGVVAPVMAVLCVGAATRRLSPQGATLAFALLLLADLWVMDATLIEKRAIRDVFAQSDLGAYLAQRKASEAQFRVYSPSYSLPRHIAARYGLETADGVDPLYLESYAAFMESASGVPRWGYGETVPALEGEGPLATLNRDATPSLALLSLLNVRYVASEFPMAVAGLSEVARFGSTYLYENVNVLPRAFVVENVESVESFDAALKWVQARDVCALAHSAVVEDGDRLPASILSQPSSQCRSDRFDSRDEIAWLSISPNRLELEATLEHPGFLVLSQVWYSDWCVEVDGQPRQLWRTDAVLSGVYLDPGEHVVSFVYRPRWTWISACASAATLGVLCLWVFYWKRKQIVVESLVIEDEGKLA